MPQHTFWCNNTPTQDIHRDTYVTAEYLWLKMWLWSVALFIQYLALVGRKSYMNINHCSVCTEYTSRLQWQSQIWYWPQAKVTLTINKHNDLGRRACPCQFRHGHVWLRHCSKENTNRHPTPTKIQCELCDITELTHLCPEYGLPTWTLLSVCFEPSGIWALMTKLCNWSWIHKISKGELWIGI